MLDWLRRMLGPCEACEILKEALAIERASNKNLMTLLLPRPEPREKQSDDSIPLDQPKQQFIPWKVRREMLEREDREKAKLMRQFDKPIEELEREVGI